MIDPPREAAVRAVHPCQEAGVHVKMITGGHPLTASAIARQIGFNGAKTMQVLTGRDLEKLTANKLIVAAVEEGRGVHGPIQRLRPSSLDALR